MPPLPPRHAAIATLLLASATVHAAPGQPGPRPAHGPNNVGDDMYFNATLLDDPGCALTIVAGHPRFSDNVTNPAMSCPDLLAWKLYIEVIDQDFIQSWASGDLLWPSDPLPLCTGDATTACCQPGSRDNPGYSDRANPGQHCPFYPGDHDAVAVSGAATGAVRRDASRVPGAREMHGTSAVQTLPVSLYNRPMYDYVFKNDLFNTNGLVAVLNNANADLDHNAPAHAKSTTGALTSINFPIDGWMIRAQWLSRAAAIAAGIQEDPRHPVIKVVLDGKPHDNFNAQVFPPGEYWLMSFHVSTKDIPDWFWANFDYVNSPGRCDYTGCNDGYGYDAPTAHPPGISRNFTSPATVDTDKGQTYVANATYASGPATPALASLLDAAGIGTGSRQDAFPTPRDRGWRSYRLRGSQWDFTDPAGRPTYDGATASNGGIVTGTSCMSCHATAGTLATGASPQILGVYFNWAGAPNPANFNLNARPATNILLQNDFVWGFLHTVPLK